MSGSKVDRDIEQKGGRVKEMVKMEDWDEWGGGNRIREGVRELNRLAGGLRRVGRAGKKVEE